MSRPTSLERDLRYALRVYGRTPFFSAGAALVLAIAIAVATAVFSLYNHLALQPVEGVRGGDRLVSIGLARDANEWIPFSGAQFRLLADALRVPDALVGSFTVPREIDVDGNVSEAMIAAVTPGFLGALGVNLLLGTDLEAASADPAAPNAVISERLWREQLGARAGAIGSTIALDDQRLTVVGVAAGEFTGLRRGGPPDDLWVPLETALAIAGPRLPGIDEARRRQMAQTMPMLRVTARLPPGVSIEQLRREIDLVAPGLREADAAATSNALMRLEALPGTAADPRQHLTLVRQSQLLVGGAVLVLLVAGLNLVSFMLARGPGRLGELRTRIAIGASGPAIVRQLFVEAMLLIGAAAGAGLLVHFWLRRLLLRLPPFADVPPGALQPQTDWRVMTFVVVAAFALTLIAGLLPAARIARQARLSLTAPTGLGSRGRNLQPLLALQVAVATLVVLASTLFLGEVRRLEQAPAGFDAAGIVAGELSRLELGGGRAPIVLGQTSAEQMESFTRDLEDRVTALPGVEGFALASAVPFHAPAVSPGVVEIDGVVEQPPEDRRRVYHDRATPEFFRVLAPRFLHGRPYDGSNPFEVVVSAGLARQLWGREDVVGERLTPIDSAVNVTSRGGFLMVFRRGPEGAEPAREVYTVVGVVDDIRYAGAGAENERPPMLYRPWSGSLLGLHYLVRGAIDAAALHAVVDELVRATFPQTRAGEPVALAAAMREATRTERARSRLGLGAAAVALLLTVVGLYASMQYMVDARRGEMAVRKALGATESAVVSMILRRAGLIVGSGCGAALLLAIGFAGRAESLLFGLNALSIMAWTAALAVVATTGFAAAWLPAVRAGRVDPAAALRHD